MKEREKLNYKQIWDCLIDAGHETFLVGGAVRDILLGVDPKDFDLATRARPGQIAAELLKNFPDADVDYVGANFGVIIADGIEIATFRGDRYGNNGNDKEVEIYFAETIEEDLSRRDFTINAMAIAHKSLGLKLIDPLGGLVDLDNKILRFVGNPADRIREDANRIIRLCRFIARTDFEVNIETIDAIKQNLHLVHAIKRDKIRIEILKAMECQNASAFWGALLFTGVLNIILPELQDCWLHVGGKHHLESVWEHTMLVGDSISTKFPLVKLAGYLHDIGKPEAWKRVLGDGFDNHHEIGADILDIRLKQLRFSNEEINIVSGLTRHHMRMVLKSTSKSSRKTLQKLHECECSWKDLVRIRIADNKSNISKSPYNPSDIKKMVASFDLDEDVPFTVKELDVSGLDLINEWELPRNRVVSDLQKHLLEFVLSGGDNNADCLLLESKNFLDAKEK